MVEVLVASALWPVGSWQQHVLETRSTCLVLTPWVMVE